MKLSILRIGAPLALSLPLASLAPASPPTQFDEPIPELGPAVELSIEDRELEEWQAELLEMAFDAVSSMPLKPHIKNRSRAQERVVIACFELDQPRRAARYVEDIVNWRQGVGYADLAFYGAQRGEKQEILDQLLDRATTLANPPVQYGKNGEELREQAWRLDRIRGKIARALLVQDREAEAAIYEADLTEAERGKQNDIRAKNATAEEFDALIAELERVGKGATFDVKRNELAAKIHLYDTFYDDEEKRAIVERTLRGAWEKMPTNLRVGYLVSMADFATEHGDPKTASRLITDAEELVEAGQWNADFHVPMLARLAQARFEAGEVDAAEELAHRAWVVFDTGKERVANVFRAEALRPLAEAYVAMGNLPKAHWIYGKVLAEGALNPNSWPRSEDLADTLCSMAVHGVEPTEELWRRIRTIHEELGPPW